MSEKEGHSIGPDAETDATMEVDTIEATEYIGVKCRLTSKKGLKNKTKISINIQKRSALDNILRCAYWRYYCSGRDASR